MMILTTTQPTNTDISRYYLLCEGRLKHFVVTRTTFEGKVDGWMDGDVKRRRAGILVSHNVHTEGIA